MLKTNAISFLPFAKSVQPQISAKTVSQPSFKSNMEEEPSVKKVYGEKGEALYLKDTKNLFEIENISDPKIGTKFILTPKAKEFKGLRILFSPDTELTSKYGETKASIVAPEVSFSGKVYGSIRQENGSSDKVMEKAYTDFFESGNAKKIADSTTPIDEDFNFYVPSDGDGTRYRDITKLLGGVTKPASRIPAKLNGEEVKLVQVVLSNFAKTGKMEGFDPVYTEPARGSAYAFLEGLASGQIPTDKPLVFSWGDNFSDIDVKKLINYHNENGADFTMLTLPVNSERISALGAVQVNSIDDLTIKQFKEKPDPSIAKDFIIPGTEDSCLAVVGPYVVSPKILNYIKEEYAKDPLSFKDEKKGFDFSAGIIERITKDDDIKVMAYQKPKEDSWSDLGSGKDFKAEMKNVKNGKFSNLPLEIKTSISNNIDDNDNISFDPLTKAVFESFCHENKIEFSNAVVYYEN